MCHALKLKVQIRRILYFSLTQYSLEAAMNEIAMNGGGYTLHCIADQIA
jgi:hypothetical protein